MDFIRYLVVFLQEEQPNDYRLPCKKFQRTLSMDSDARFHAILPSVTHGRVKERL